MTVPDLVNVDENSRKNFWSAIKSNCSDRRFVAALCLLLTIVAVGLFLRLNEIDSRGFFGDEIYSVLVANGTGDPELIAFDSIRPVYFFLLKLWMNFGTSDLWLRLPSVFFGTTNIALTYWLGSIAAGRKAGLVAAALMAFSPMEIHYSQQARMYTLGSFLGLLGSLFFIKTWETGKSQFLFAWGIVRTLMVWTLPLTATLLGVDFVLALWKERKNKLMPAFGISFFLVVSLFLLFAWRMPQITASSEYDSWRYNLPIPQISDALMMFVNFTSTALPLQECEGPWEGGVFATAYSVMMLLLMGVSFLPAKKSRWLIWCSAWALLPAIAALIASQFKGAFVITRYLMFLSPFAFIMMGAGWLELWKPLKIRVLAVAAAVLYCGIIVANLAHFYSSPVHEDYREIGKFFEKHAEPGDNIVIWNYHSACLLHYYFKGSNKAYDLIVDFKHDKQGHPNELFIETPGMEKISGRTWIVMREAPEAWKTAWATNQLLLRHLDSAYKVLEKDRTARTDIYLVTAK